MKAAEVIHALGRRYGTVRIDPMGNEWSLLPEFALAPGGGQQRIDALAVRNWRGKPAGHERHALEVKVSRSDLLNELANPDKRAPFVAVTHRFYLATPVGLVRDGELPDDCGLIEVHEDGKHTRLARRAPRRADPDDLPPGALIEALRRASKAEHRLLHEPSPEAELARLRLEVERLEGQVQRARAAARREEDRARHALQLVEEAADGLVCICGKPIGRAGRRWSFKHDDGTACVREAGGHVYESEWAQIDLDRLHAVLAIPESLPDDY